MKLQSNVISLCFSCRHIFRDGRRGCAAFPQGIPDALLQGRDNHDHPHPGDNGIRYELAEDFKPLPKRA